MSQQDFQDRLARLGTAPQPGAAPAPAPAPQPQSRAPIRAANTEPGPMDVARGLILGFLASLGASMVEFHLWLGGDAMAYIDGRGSMVGIVAIMAIAYVLGHALPARGFLGTGGTVAGVLAEILWFESMLPHIAPGLAATLFNDQYASLIRVGYSITLF